ncbi:polyprenyl synthetase family protein [Kitasatospora sp. NPDC127121]|uniref:polyprenyl synthetase family protein n=1 Tax=Kitasatospora sp. NPDC127121 TaxID=3345371 RepID=UPI003631778B
MNPTETAGPLTVPPGWFAAVGTEIAMVLEDLRRDHPSLADAVTGLLAADGGGRSPFRLLGMAVLGTITGEPRPAAAVCAVSRLWWAGAEALDDLADGQGPAAPRGRSELARTTLAAVACGSTLPHRVADRYSAAPDIRLSWEQELVRTALDALEGQLADIAEPADDPVTWRSVMACYRGKSGAAYGRDAVMAARLATDRPETLRSWRTFGELFGVLRQLGNDGAPSAAQEFEDLANGTRTLLLAHALAVAAPAHREHLLDLHARAGTDPGARGELRTALRDPSVLDGYERRVESLRQHCCAVLDRLAPDGPYRELLHGLVHTSARAVPNGVSPCAS